MTLDKLDNEHLAEMIIDQHYDDDITDHDTLTAYLGEYFDIHPELNQSDIETPTELHNALRDALDADIADMLTNDFLLGDDLDWELHTQPDRRLAICSLIAATLIARIYPEGI